MQIVGELWQEKKVLRVAYAWGLSFDWRTLRRDKLRNGTAVKEHNLNRIAEKTQVVIE